MLIKIH
jgi:hypothetical protein